MTRARPRPAYPPLRFEDAAGRTLLALQSGDTDVTGAPCPVPFGCTRLGDGTCTFHVSFAARPDEQFYGLGGPRFAAARDAGYRLLPYLSGQLQRRHRQYVPKYDGPSHA